MSKTNVGAGSPNAQFVQAAGLFAQSMQRNSTLGDCSRSAYQPSRAGEISAPSPFISAM